MKFSERRLRDKIKKDISNISKKNSLIDTLQAQVEKIEELISIRKYKEAEAFASLLIAEAPEFYLLWKLLADTLYLQGKTSESLVVKQKIVENFPDRADASYNLGNAQFRNHEFANAFASFDRAVSLKPDFAEAHLNKAHALCELWQFEEALVVYEASLKFKLDFAEAYNGLGVCFSQLNRQEEALHAFSQAISIQENYAEAYCNRGAAFADLEIFDKALEDNLRSIKLQPNLKKAHYNIGLIYAEEKKFEMAEKYFNQALNLEGDAEGLEDALLFLFQQTCQFDKMQEYIDLLLTNNESRKITTDPFHILSVSTSPKINLESAREKSNKISLLTKPREFRNAEKKNEKIRIGYFSSDLREHAGGHLIVDLLETHNKDKFEIHAFSLSNKNVDADLEKEIRGRIVNAVDYFHDVSSLSDHRIVDLARENSIDIALDVNGYTQYAKTAVFASRAAPIQINYLGFPGTMGAEFVDYIVADHTLIPENYREYFSEKIIYMPGSCQPNDRKRIISKKIFSKRDLNLSEDTFVYGCFNNSYKILPDFFAAWMHILKMVENSVLVLLETNASAKLNLWDEAKKFNIDPDRIIFCPFLPHADHLARYGIVDLFVDTLPYNAHTTASDALWSGVPVLTCKGNTFSGRVCASLLNAVGLPELITNNLEDYKNLAIELGRGKQISELKSKLKSNLSLCSLFDTENYTRNIETAYQKIFDLHISGLPKQHIFVGSN
jgi:predicted O-linked N-acetylglucosamine transferase (SPINDLY family)